MSIHYAVIAKAEKAGVQLTEESDKVVRAFQPKTALEAFGANGGAALEQIHALVRIKSVDDSRIVVQDKDDRFMVRVFNHDRSKTPLRDSALPTEVLEEILRLDQANKRWLSTVVPTDGGEAHKQGFTAADNPFSEDGDESSQQWDDEFDAAADAEGEEDDAGGSVVKPEYRIRYAEAGHPNHCGDWLAVTLNNLILGKTQTDIEHFEELCNLNGVSLAKYNRTTAGWQGRLRMTGRNLLVKPVAAAGVLMVPPSVQQDGVDRYPAPAEWLSSLKIKTKKAAVILEAGRAAKAEPPSVQEQLARRKAASKNKK